MKFTTIIILLLSTTSALTQTTFDLKIIEKEDHNAMIGVNVYSFARDTCFVYSNIDGMIHLTVEHHYDTLFQLEYIGCHHTVFNVNALNQQDTISIKYFDSAMTLGTDGLTKIKIAEEINANKKCGP